MGTETATRLTVQNRKASLSRKKRKDLTEKKTEPYDIKVNSPPKVMEESPSLEKMSLPIQPSDEKKKTADQNRSNLKRLAINFATETSLHGIKYIAEDGRHWIER